MKNDELSYKLERLLRATVASDDELLRKKPYGEERSRPGF